MQEFLGAPFNYTDMPCTLGIVSTMLLPSVSVQSLFCFIQAATVRALNGFQSEVLQVIFRMFCEDSDDALPSVSIISV